MNANSLRFTGRALLWGAVLSLLSLPGISQATTLVAVYTQARERDMQYSVARRTLEAAMEKVPQARAGLLPSVVLNGNPQRQSGTASFSGAPGESRDVRSWSWNVQMTQPLFRLGQWAALDQADAQVRQAEAQFAQAEQELILRVAQAYLDVVLANDSLSVAQSQVQAVAAQLQLAERNRAVGTGTQADVHEAEARLALSRSQRVAAAGELMNRQAEIERLLGEAVELPRRRLERNLPPLPADEIDLWGARAASGSPLVRMQQAGLEVAQKETARSRSGHLPTLDLVVGHGANFSSGTLTSPANTSTQVNSSQIGLQLSLPLFSGGSTQSRIRESLVLEDKVRDELTGAERSARAQAKQAFAGVVNGQAQIEALESAVKASRHAVEANRIGFTVGTRINPDVLNAEQQLYQAMRDLMKARVETVVQSLRLKAVAGVLEAADLAAVDQLMVNGK